MRSIRNASFAPVLLVGLLSGCPGELNGGDPASTWSGGADTWYTTSDSASSTTDSASSTTDSGVAPVGDQGSAGATCGNGSCESGESCASCPADCGSCTPQTLTFNAVADAYVDEGKPTTNYGQATTLATDQSPDQIAILRFSVTTLPSAALSAKLRLYVTNSTSDGPAVYRTTDSWTETGVTWNNRPKPGGSAIKDLGSVPTGWLEIDVTSVLKAKGSYSFLLVPTSTNGMDFSSREGSNKPQLVIKAAGGPPPAQDAGAVKPDTGLPKPDGGPPPKLDSGVPPGPTAFSFFAVGDTRSNQSIAQQCFQSMSLLDPKAIAVFNSGDLTADGKDSQWLTHVNAVNLGSAGKISMKLTGWSSGTMRYFGIVGNHDTHESSWLTSWNKYLSGQKGLGSNSTSGVYFAVSYKNAIFIVLDSENTTTGAQTTWLQQTLAAAAANTAIQWKFVFYHHPVYPCNYKSPWSSGIPWVRLFEKYKVDMVFNGHAHVYERTCAMVGGVCQAGGVRYVISGGGGAGTKSIEPLKKATVGTDSYDCSQTLKNGKGNWHHYCRIAVDGKKLSYACYKYDTTASPEDTLSYSK